MQIKTSKTKLCINSGEDWSEAKLSAIYEEIERIASDKYGYDIYPNQIDIITSEQMLDAYAANALPIYYNHWSYGQKFLQQSELYKRGMMGLAYEVVINSNPCVSYLMEENTMVLQTLVMAHAAIGHNHFFKNNYMMKKWTDASSIVPFLSIAKQFISKCEELHGPEMVEHVLDSAHVWQMNSIDKYKRPPTLSSAGEQRRLQERLEFEHQQINDIWSTVPSKDKNEKSKEAIFPPEPVENILKFVEENSPQLDNWVRGIIRIVRNLAQYYYPNMSTAMPNEGFACYVHNAIMHDLFDEGFLTEGAFMEYLVTHTNVVHQVSADPRKTRNTNINIYPLGYYTMHDIHRAAEAPTAEDREWYSHQDWVGNMKGHEAVKWVVKNFKTDSFISQFLHPKTMRKFKMYSVLDDEADEALVVTAIQDKTVNYKKIRDDLSKNFDITYSIPDIQVKLIDRWGNRTMHLEHKIINGVSLHNDSMVESLKHLSRLWGYPIILTSVDENNVTVSQYEVSDEESLLDIFISS